MFNSDTPVFTPVPLSLSGIGSCWNGWPHPSFFLFLPFISKSTLGDQTKTSMEHTEIGDPICQQYIRDTWNPFNAQIRADRPQVPALTAHDGHSLLGHLVGLAFAGAEGISWFILPFTIARNCWDMALFGMTRKKVSKRLTLSQFF